MSFVSIWVMVKKIVPTSAQKYVVLHALPSGVVSLYVAVIKEESQWKTFSQVGNKENNLLKVFLVLWIKKAYARFWERVHQKGIQARVYKVYKTQNFEGTYFMDGPSKSTYPKSFGLLYTLYNNSKKILWAKFLLLNTEFWAVQP